MKSRAARGGIDRMFRVFSDRTRIRILHLLREGELCVGDIVTILRTPQAKTSRHLATLRRARLVFTRKQGLWNFYALVPAGNSFHAKLLECLAACFSQAPEFSTDRRRAREIRKSGGCCPP